MRTGVTISILGHAAVLMWGLVTFSAKPLLAPSDSLPVDLISATEFSELMAGAKKAPTAKVPKPVVEKIAEPKPAENPVPKVVEKPEIVAASAVVPEPTPEPKIAESKPVPVPPAARPEPKKEPEKKPESKPDQIAELLKKEKKTEPRKQAEPQPKFDAQRIAALLDKRDPQRRAATGEMLNSMPSLGVTTGNAPQLSQTEIDALRAQIQACWNPPAGAAEAKDLIVQVRIMLKQDGSLSGEPVLVNRGGNAFFQIAAESAIRAVRRCQPYKLPIAKYEVWKDVEVTFDPRDMYRG
jgi:outer membrane biosynthesis protein TonB